MNKKEFEEKYKRKFQQHSFTQNLVDDVWQSVEQYAIQMCKKQRDICANIQTADTEPPFRSLGDLEPRFKRAILNAPLPKELNK